MTASEPSVFIRQLAALKRRHPTAKLLTVVPRPQLGMALHTAATQECGSLAGFTPRTLAQLAAPWGTPSLRAKGFEELKSGPRFFLTQTALQRLSPSSTRALAGERSLPSITQPLAQTFGTLRRHDISPKDYQSSTPNTPRQEALTHAFSAYETLLDQHELYDSARLFKTATQALREHSPTLPGTVLALVDTVQVSATSRAFLTGLRSRIEEPLGTYRLGSALETSPNVPASPSPPDRVAAQFSDCPHPPEASNSPSPAGRIAIDSGAELPPSEAKSFRFWTATGTRREIQAVFEDIVASETPLDRVEIAFTDPSPYLAHLDALSERYEIPVSLSMGRSIEATRPGQALLEFFDWIAEGFPASTLIRLLRSGLLQLDEPIGEEEKYGVLNSQRAASLLASRRYGEVPYGYRQTFEQWREEVSTELSDLRATSSNPAWLEESLHAKRKEKAEVEALSEGVKTLLQLGQAEEREPVSPSDMAEGAETLLEVFGPTPKPSDSTEEHSPDEAARNLLIKRLQRLKQTARRPKSSRSSLATQMSKWVRLRPFVAAQQPRPGEAHVVPLQSAGYTNRDHLYVLGLDAASAGSDLQDDPVLSDEEREALADPDDSFPLPSDQADTDAWLTARAFARHEGTVTLSACTYDVTDEEELFEAPLYIRLQEAVETSTTSPLQSSAQAVHHSLSVPPNRALSALDRWTAQASPAPSTVEAALKNETPWIQDGLDAAHARAADRFTVYDGLLASRSYPGLNPLARSSPLAAGELETYARAPFAYFLRHVLDVSPPEEPALDEIAWLDARDRGAVLHQTFSQFLSRLQRPPTREDEPLLRETFTKALHEKREQIPPPSEVVYASTRRQLWHDAQLFLRAEASRTDEYAPEAFELGFGIPPHRRSETDLQTAPTIDLPDISFALRGRIDRVDRHPDDHRSLWDYKTGSSRSFEEDDLLADGRHLQWALYAYAYEALRDTSVQRAGYFFTSTGEMGKRLSANPQEVREEVARILRRIGDAISAGAFPINDGEDLKYSFDALFHDFNSRQSELRNKTWPKDRPVPPALMNT